MTKPRLKLKSAESTKPGGGLYFAAPKTHHLLISSGCELLNCVLGGGYVLGRFVNVIGDKSTGKSLLAIEAMCNFQREYENGLTVYDETEHAFDNPYAEALGWDASRTERGSSETVEDVFDHMESFIARCLKAKAPGLYILDSLDALSDKEEKGRKFADATYNMTKQKQMGQLFRRLIGPLEKSKVCLMIVSQVRDAIGVTFGEKHVRAGGKALDFYASQILWLAHKGRIKRTISKIERVTGVTIKAKTSKCKVGLPFRECEFDIVFGYGVDDVGASIDFLQAAGALARLDLQVIVDKKADEDTKAKATQRALVEFKSTLDSAGAFALSEVAREVWYEIEAQFLPLKGKYQ